jgi:hypothetical protein
VTPGQFPDAAVVKKFFALQHKRCVATAKETKVFCFFSSEKKTLLS